MLGSMDNAAGVPEADVTYNVQTKLPRKVQGAPKQTCDVCPRVETFMDCDSL